MEFLLLILFLYSVVNISVRFNPSTWFAVGEKAIAYRYLSQLSDEYTVFNDVLLESEDGSTHQIDHIVVSPYGIVVIETKDFGGKVYGGYRSKHWTQYLGGQGFDFYNPIYQNRGHIKALKQVVGLPDEYFVSIVVFSRRTILKNNHYSTEKDHEFVLSSPNLLPTMRNHSKHSLNEELIEHVCQQIEVNNIQSRENRQRHVENVEEVKKKVSTNTQ
jgi:hypothetical protein